MAATAQTRVRASTYSALRNPNFRLYFAGQLVSTAGTWMQNIAQGFLVFRITQSELWLGIVACAAGLPLLLLSPFAGVVIERVPRRRLMLITQTVQMILAFILATLTFLNTVQVWNIVALAFVLGVSNAFDAPARQAFVMEIVGRDELHSGIALNSILVSSSRVLGPAAAGVALVAVGPAWCFLLNGLSFLAVIASLLIMQVPFAIRRIGSADPLQQLEEGLSYARRSSTIAPLLLLTATVGLFGIPIGQVLPAFASVILRSPKEGYAAVSVGQGVGSVVAGAVVGWLAYRLGRGRLIAIMVILAGLGTLALGLQVTIPTATIVSIISGLFVVLLVISINTLIQSVVPDEFRGRVLSLYSLSFFGLAPFGALLLGFIANKIGVDHAISLYGVISGVLGALILARWPALSSHE